MRKCDSCLYGEKLYDGTLICQHIVSMQGKETTQDYGIECTADYIENMCIKYGAKQVIIDTSGFGIAVCDSLFNKKLPWLDIVPVHCISDR